MIPLYKPEEFNSAKSRDKLPLKCKQCGKTFYKEKSQIQSISRRMKYDFCSHDCSSVSQTESVGIICCNCNKFFTRIKSQINKSQRNFCSQSCSTTYSNTHKTKGTRRSKLEKWLETKLPLLCPNLEFHFNRKDAINSELDIYIPNLKLAFELNGIFHYEPIYGDEKLSSIQNNDNRKMQACLEQGIELCIIDVSHLKYFKEKNCIPFLEIIQNIISLKIQSTSNEVV